VFPIRMYRRPPPRYQPRLRVTEQSIDDDLQRWGADLQSNSMEVSVRTSGRWVESYNEYGDYSQNSSERDFNFRFRVDVPSEVRFVGRSASESNSTARVRIFGGFPNGPTEVDVRLFDNTTADVTFQLLPGFTYTVEALASSRLVGINSTTSASLEFSLTAIPEPATALLLGLGLVGLHVAGPRSRAN